MSIALKMKRPIGTFVITAALMAGACGSVRDGLDSFEGRLVVNVWSGRTDVMLYPRSVEGHCQAAAADFTGTLNGVPMQIVSRGGRVSRGFSYVCDYPYLQLSEPVAPTADGRSEIRIWDATGRIEAAFEDFLSPRVATIVAPAAQPVYLGDEVAVGLSPPWLASHLTGAVELWAAPPKSHTVWTFQLSVAGRKTGDEVRFVIPAADRESSVTPLIYEVTPSIDSMVLVYRCEGISGCQVGHTDRITPADLSVVNRGHDETELCYRCQCPCAVDEGEVYSVHPFRCEPRPCQCAEGVKIMACTSHVPVPACPVQVPVAGGDCSAYGRGPCHFQNCSAMGITNVECTVQKTWKLTSVPCHPTPCGATKTCAAGDVCLTDKSGADVANTCIPNPCDTGPVSPDCLALGTNCSANYGVPSGLTITCE